MSSNMTSVEKDTTSRNRIVSETNKNFFVEAGAGSGKTTMLVSRMVAMVESGIDISKICAITFTKAAAGEFYDRFQKALIERSNPDYKWEDKGQAGQLPAPTEVTRKRCADALQNIDLCFMGTIDSFCNMVLSEHPVEAGIPSDANLLSDEEVQDIYKQAYVKICSGEDIELKQQAYLFRTLHSKADDVFVRGESFLMNNRNVDFKYSPQSIVDIDSLYANERTSINKALDCLIKHPEIQYQGNKLSDAAWEKLPNAVNTLKRKWSTNFTSVVFALKGLSNLRVNTDALNLYNDSLVDCFEPGGAKGGWLEFIPAKNNGVCDRLNSLRYDISMTFLFNCIPVIEKMMRDKSAMTFFDYLYYLRNMLKKDAAMEGKLINYIYDRHSYFLIDEFQDTNPMQAEVFFYLSSEKPVEQWSACVPRPGSLFIVGDPKQSIYRFRSADVTSFLKVKKLFEENGGDILYLSRNFRSTQRICNYFNNVFGKMLPEETTVQSKFEDIPLPSEDKDEFQGVYTYTAYTGAAEFEHPNETNPEQIKKIIKGLVGNENFKISLGDGKVRSITYSDIMVISYGKGNIDSIMRTLAEEEIPMRTEGSVPFGRNEALTQISVLYKAVADPSSCRALYDALKCYFIGSCEEEMMKLVLAGGTISLNSIIDLPEDADPTAVKVASYIAKIKALAYKARKLSPAALFAEIMDNYKVYMIAPVENMEVLYYTLELIRAAEKAGTIVSLKDASEYIDTLVMGLASEERCLSINENKDCVHIANLHKVKGLEAPVVILSAGVQFGGSISSRIEHTDNGSEGYIFNLGVRNENGGVNTDFETSEFDDKKDEEKTVMEAEHTRLLYVAATRARNALIICDSYTAKARKSIWKPLMAYDTEDIFEKIGEIESKEKEKKEEVEVAPLYEKANAECVLNDRKSEAASFAIENPSKTRLASKIDESVYEDFDIAEDNEGEDENASDDEENGGKSKYAVSDAHRFPALLGTMTHRLMEVIVTSHNTCKTDAVIGEIIREFRTPINQPYEQKLTAALTGVANKVLNGGYDQANKAPKDVLNVLLNAQEVYCEVPFCYKDSNEAETTIWNGIMDVIYKVDDKWHIIDYKTNVDGSSLDKKYLGQLEAYKKALKATIGVDADAYTYHIDI